MSLSPFERLVKELVTIGTNLWTEWTKEKAPALRDSPGENHVYALCEKLAYKNTKKEVLDDLHFVFQGVYKRNLRPIRQRKVLGELIYENVARISCKETMDKLIMAYDLIYIYNTNQLKKA